MEQFDIMNHTLLRKALVFAYRMKITEGHHSLEWIRQQLSTPDMFEEMKHGLHVMNSFYKQSVPMDLSETDWFKQVVNNDSVLTFLSQFGHSECVFEFSDKLLLPLHDMCCSCCDYSCTHT